MGLQESFSHFSGVIFLFAAGRECAAKIEVLDILSYKRQIEKIRENY
jgi:hypothetical protein